LGSTEVIVIDTHIWVWWVQGDSRLTPKYQQWLQQYWSQGLGVSIFSCWEITKLVEKDRLELPNPLNEWFEQALAYPGVQLLDLTVPILIEATKLVGFHRDPGDQIIVATTRVYGCPLLTADQKILGYSGVETLQ
jgi:PIN domain nuclease of toxin-antitoxin system